MEGPATDDGRVTRVRGSVVDVTFDGDAPFLHEALKVESDMHRPLVLEVQQHLDPRTVRTVVMEPASGLRRGASVARTHAPLMVPVGPAVLGRVIDVLGRPIDGGSPFPADVPRLPIHREAPPFQEQGARREPFLTGIKVIDLLAPLVQGGKAGMFGGAGVGQDRADHGAHSHHRRAVQGRVGVRRRGRAVARRPRAAPRAPRFRNARSHGAGVRSDERTAGRALARGTGSAHGRRALSRHGKAGRAAAHGQRVSFRPGRQRGLRAAWPLAVPGWIPADAGERDRRATGAHRPRGRSVHHGDRSGLRTGGRLHRSGGGGHLQPPGFLHRAVSRDGERGSVPRHRSRSIRRRRCSRPTSLAPSTSKRRSACVARSPTIESCKR